MREIVDANDFRRKLVRGDDGLRLRGCDHSGRLRPRDERVETGFRLFLRVEAPALHCGPQFRFGRLRGTLLASSIYGGVHLVSENLTLTGAAATAGLFWGAVYAREDRVAPLIISHVAWDIWIFLIAPTVKVMPSSRRN